MNVNELDPYDEAQHILEVLQRGNPLKGITTDGGIIQIEQSNPEHVEIVLNELRERGYKIISQRKYADFAVVGIKKEKVSDKKETKNQQNEKSSGLEIGD